MALVVPDASIILKWALAGEDDAEEEAALDLLSSWIEGRDQIIFPSLWVFEVGNVIGRKRPQNAVALMSVLLDYEFEEVPMTREITELALGLMDRLKVTFYDASYHAVALARDAVFVTADRRYCDKAAKVGQVRLLGQP